MIELKEHNNFYVITGGPGAGKTTLLEELRNRNYDTVPEIAREIIKKQQAHNGNALPWKDKHLYKDMMFERSVKSFAQAEKDFNRGSVIFFDRGFLDTICYARLIQSEPNERMDLYAKSWRYNKSVFMLPPWQVIYETDDARKQSWKESVLTFETMCETYRDYGYNIIEVPKVSVSRRADFVLSFVAASK